jgi:hypothetical protein
MSAADIFRNSVWPLADNLHIPGCNAVAQVLKCLAPNRFVEWIDFLCAAARCNPLSGAIERHVARAVGLHQLR